MDLTISNETTFWPIHFFLLLLLLLLSWRVRQALPIWGDKNVPKRWGNQPDSKSGGIRLSLVIVDSRFVDWGTTRGRLSLPTADVLSTFVKRSMLTDVDKLSSCSRFSDSVVGFTGQKTQPTASKYWRSVSVCCTKGSFLHYRGQWMVA